MEEVIKKLKYEVQKVILHQLIKATSVLVEKESRKEISSYTCGGSNRNSVGDDVAKKNVFESILMLLEKTNISLEKICGISLGILNYKIKDYQGILNFKIKG
jgi:N-acetylglucosamine kinase-like BadF-type ATPase